MVVYCIVDGPFGNLEEEEGAAAIAEDLEVNEDCCSDIKAFTSNTRSEQSALPEASAVPSELKETECTESE